MTFDEFAQYLGRFIAYGATSIGLFWLIFKKAAERWIDGHFAKRQKEFEHEQAKELPRIKAKLDTVIQGSLKLQEREFKIIPEAWEKVSEAYGLARWLCSPMQSYISLKQMSGAHLEEFLSKQEMLWETQKKQIGDTPAGSRDALWQEIETGMRYSKACARLAAAETFIKVNSIFIPSELCQQFNKQIKIIWEALVSFKCGSDSQPKDYPLIREAWDKLDKEGEPLHEQIEIAVRKRLLEQTQISDEKLQSVN